jgi:hypothetical protein
MAVVMSHKEWMKLTYGGVTAIRSGKLKQVDAALAAYHQAPGEPALEALRKALMTWISDKGADWKTSVRNAHNAVDTLHKQIMGGAGLAVVDVAARKAVEDEARQAMLLLLRGAKITWKNEFRGRLNSDLVKPHTDGFAAYLPVKQFAASASTNKFGTAGNSVGLAMASKQLNDMRKGADAGGGVGGMISKLVSQVVPSGAQTEVLNAVRVLVPNFHAEFAASVMPLAGILTAAGTTLWNTGNALHKHYGVTQARMHRERSLAGVEASSAIAALIQILERERNADIYSATVSVTELGGKIAGLAIDGGTASNTAIGLAANIAKLLNIVRIVYRDVSEKNAANKLMATGQISIDIFETCPLLGCYLVCCLPTSALMSLIMERFGQTGWMDVAERTASHHVQPLREKARQVIAGHRFEIRQLARFPGMLKENEEEKARMLANVGKSGMVSFSAKDFADQPA